MICRLSFIFFFSEGLVTGVLWTSYAQLLTYAFWSFFFWEPQCLSRFKICRLSFIFFFERINHRGFVNKLRSTFDICFLIVFIWDPQCPTRVVICRLSFIFFSKGLITEVFGTSYAQPLTYAFWSFLYERRIVRAE